MFKVKFITDKSFDRIMTDLDRKAEGFKLEISSLGEEVSDFMKNNINSKKVRPQAGEPSRLEDSIEATHFVNGDWGVGEIDKMTKEAPHWRAVNYGSRHMVGKQMPKGVFNPGEPAPNRQFNRDGRFKKGEDYNGEQYAPIVKNPIPPMDYITDTLNFIRNRILVLRAKLARK